jgi:bifunctional UDP-N-acetylglucosamine pyrophosphorylase/glucosamine-1-phosphate N-acetyltransferase
MLDGVTIIDPSTTYIEMDVKIGRDTIIRPFTVIEHGVKIGERCSIGPFARLRPGTEIADEAEIGNFGEVSRTKFGKNSLMKHFGFLGDARIGSKVNIGAGVVTANYDGVNKNITQISDGAFIGSDSILVAPVKIGTRAATGAGAVVKKGTHVPQGKVAAGIPARIISRRKF